MECGICTITVYFEDPFWVGVYEREDEAGYQVSKIVFGAEPKDYEVYEMLINHWAGLCFSPLSSKREKVSRRQNPKRERHEVKKRLLGPPIGTKAQEALKLQYVQRKESIKQAIKAEQKENEERQFQLRQNKKKQKHRGH